MKQSNTQFQHGMRESGKRLAEILRNTVVYITNTIDTGLTKNDVNTFIVQEMQRLDCRPLFLGHDAGSGPFPKESIVCINEEIVHAIPDDTPLTAKDLITIDIGIAYNGFCTDAARTLSFDKENKQHTRLIQATEDAFEAACRIIRGGVDIYHIGKVIENTAHRHNVRVVESLTGHGIGRKMWEPPHIFQIPYEHGILPTGKTVAIEPIFSLGSSTIHTGADHWVLSTQDKSLAAQYENTLLITEKGCEVLTR